MLKHELLPEAGILILSPEGPLQQSDFEALAREIDPYIEAQGGLRGLLVQAEAFPGWADFAALLAHLKFVKNHHQHVAKVAAVTDSGFLSILPAIVGHFVHAEARHFDPGEKDKAMEWLQAGSD